MTKTSLPFRPVLRMQPDHVMIQYGETVMKHIAHNPTAFSAFNQTDIRILRGACVTLDERWKARSSTQPYTRLYFVRSGSGFLTTPEQSVTMRSGHVYLIPPECSLSYGCEKLEKLFFHITISTVEQYDLLAGVPGICELPFPPKTLQDMSDCLHSDNYYDVIRLKMLLLQVITDFARTYSFAAIPVRQYSELVRRIIRHVQHNTRISLSVTELSADFYLSQSKLRNAFREETGIPLGRYIDDMVFIKAKQLLLQRDLSILDVSTRLGFCDQFYFSRRFKEKFRMTPSEYRRANEI